MDDSPRDSSALEKRLDDAIARQQAKLDAFIEETKNILSELEATVEEVRELAEQEAEIPEGFEERLDKLESSKMDAPTEMELRRRDSDMSLIQQHEEELQEELELKLLLIDERIDSLDDGIEKHVDENENSMQELTEKLAELEAKVTLLQEQLRSRLK